VRRKKPKSDEAAIVPFEKCLEKFLATEDIPDFFSTATKAKGARSAFCVRTHADDERRDTPS
jgi:hypothetical protein